MKRLFGSTLALTALLTLLSGCTQPKASCSTGVGGFAVKYTLKSGSTMGTGACDTLKGETLGLMKYNPLKEGEEMVQDLTRAFLVIRTSQLGQLAADDMSMAVNADEIVSRGDFVSTTPDDNDVCSVPDLSTAQGDLQIVDEAMNTVTHHIEYAWSDIRLYVTAAYPGTQMVGTLTYTDNADTADCTASYSVLGLWPNIDCSLKDGDGAPMKDGDGNFEVDEALCDPIADPDNGRPTGSGINPDLKERLACDKTIGLCVLTEAPPALK
jgi:hypothetical protein